MKKLLLLFLMSLTYSISFSQSNWDKSNCEKCSENHFIFDKITIARIEKESKAKQTSNNEEDPSLYAIILTNENDDLSSGKRIKLSSIPNTDKFILIGNSIFDVLIQNINSKLFYVIKSTTFDYIDYSRTDNDGFRGLIKVVPKTLSAKDQELVKRYKSLIKSGQGNAIVLRNIQNKCMTKGYFDERKMTKIDKQTWNKNLSSLKITYAKLNDINKFEDKDNRAQDKLTTSELGSLENMNIWLSNYFTIN